MQEFLYRLQLVRGDMLRTGPTDAEQAVVAEHFAYLQDLTAQGVIILVGRTLTTDENTMGLSGLPRRIRRRRPPDHERRSGRKEGRDDGNVVSVQSGLARKVKTRSELRNSKPGTAS